MFKISIHKAKDNTIFVKCGSKKYVTPNSLVEIRSYIKEPVSYFLEKWIKKPERTTKEKELYQRFILND